MIRLPKFWKETQLKILFSGTWLVVQWLRLHTVNVEGLGLTPGQETRSHMPQRKIWHATMKIKGPVCLN